MTSRKKNFRFRVLVMCRLRMALMHRPTKICANSSIQFGVIDIFRNPRLRPPPCSIFKSCKFGTFRHVNSVMLELYIKFGSNTCDSHRDQHTYAPDIQTYCVPGIRLIYTPLFIIIMTSHKKTSCFEFWSNIHLMTSRELTSGFDFWSRVHLRVAVMHPPI